jgi:hypothetical protein
MEYNRVFNNVYTLAVQVTAGVINNSSTPIYFNGYPVLRGKKIKAITYSINNIPLAQNSYFLTLIDGNKKQLLYNYPVNNLQQNYNLAGNILPYNKLNLFNLYDIDLLNSYWIYPNNVSWTVTGVLFRLNFYWD